MKLIKRILFSIASLVVVLVFLAFLLPFLFKDKLIQAVKDQVNESIEAEVNFEDVDLSLFRNFPSFSLGLTRLDVKGKGEFEGIPLIKAQQFDMALDFWSVVGGGNPLKLNGVFLEEPEINVYVLKNAKANYDIAKPSAPGQESTSEETGDFLIQLERYTINEGIIHYEDRTMGLVFDAFNFNHTGSGDFTASIYDLITATEIDQMSLSYDGIEYFKRAKTRLDAILQADMEQMKFTLKDNDLTINALHLLAEGWVQLKEEDILMDLSFSAPSNNFKELFSLVPQAYMADYANVKVDGNFSLKAEVKGTYNGEKEQMPAFKVDMNVENGNVLYPGAPFGISGIVAKLMVNSPSSNMDQMVVHLPNFAFQMGKNPFAGSFLLKTPLSDPDVDTKVKGIIDLDAISEVMPMDGIQQLDGILDADFALKARMSSIDQGQYDRVNAGGYLRLKDFLYQATGSPAVKIKSMEASLTPEKLLIENFDGNMGKSDLRANGYINNLLAYFHPDKTMTGSLVARSGILDLNEWMETESNTPAPPSTAGEAEVGAEVFDRFDFNLDGQADVIKYDVYTLLNTVAVGKLSPSRMEIDRFSTQVGKSDLAAKGTVENIFNYLFKNEKLIGTIYLDSKLLDLNELMGTETVPAAQEENAGSEPIAGEVMLVPESFDLVIHSDIDRVLYSNFDLRNISGQVVVRNEEASLQNVSADGLGGSMSLNGYYNTQDKENPKFMLNYGLQQLAFQDAFQTFNTFEKLAPIGQYISGRFNSTMTINGVLGKDQMPEISSLDAEGFLATLDGVLSGFGPLEKAGDLLGISEFKNLAINNLKTWFTVEDGKVTVKEFPAKVQNMDLLIGGSHSLTQEMDYLIKAKIPRKLMEKNALTSSANQGLNLLSKEAGKLGISLASSEFVNVGIRLTGSVDNPKVGIKLLGADGESTGVIESVKTQVKEQVEEKVEEVKSQVKEEVQAQKEDLKLKADAEIKNLMQKAEASAKKIREEGRKLAEEGKKISYDQAAKLEKEAGNNPIKKAAAKVAADKLRKEADEKAAGLIREADKRADDVLTKANQEAEKIRDKYKDQ